jgi:hypothetical protein
MTFPSVDLSTFYAGAGVIFTALIAIWAVRKVIKLLNRS